MPYEIIGMNELTPID